MTIGERLRYWRKQHNLTAQELADATNTSQAVISCYERGQCQISTKFTIALYEVYNVNILWLLTGEEQNSIKDKNTEEEQQLLKNYRYCNQEGKAALRTTAAALAISNNLINLLDEK